MNIYKNNGELLLEVPGDTLQNANLLGANLQNANLQNANLRVANLQGADLQGADLQGANLQNANLQNANLREADLRRANLQEADLQNADLRGANIDYSCWPLWCGSLGVKIDKKIACQLLHHTYIAMTSITEDDEINAFLQSDIAKSLVAQFHRFNECGGFNNKGLFV